MAYMSQDRKQQIAPKVKELLKKYNLTGSLSVDNHSTLVLTIKSGKIDFVANQNRVCSQDLMLMKVARGFIPTKSAYVNPYHYQEHFDGEALAFLSEVIPALNEGNWNKSDIQSDYFNVGWHADVNIGRWNKPYEVTA
jgi:hypothetical protein